MAGENMKVRNGVWNRISLGALLLGLLSAHGAARAANPLPGYVYASGTQFMLDAKPYRPVGYNNYRLTSAPLPAPYRCGGDGFDDAELKSIFDQMQSAGTTVVRTWFFQNYVNGRYDHEHLYLAAGWEPFDRVLKEAQARGMKVIPVLVNRQEHCEPTDVARGFPFFQGNALDQPDNPEGYDRVQSPYGRSFMDYASHVAGRYSKDVSFGGVIIRPTTIAWWQLVNEASISTAAYSCDSAEAEAAAAKALRSFADVMVGVIKEADPNHLVSLGTTGENDKCGLKDNDYLTVHQGLVDMCEVHDYFGSTQALHPDVQLRLTQCTALGKPIFIGEAGIDYSTHTELERAKRFDNKIVAQFSPDAASQDSYDAYLIWQKIEAAADYGDDQYGVGPGSLVEKITRGWSGQYGTIVSDWEDGDPTIGVPPTTRGWQRETSTLVIEGSSDTSYTRLQSLLVANTAAFETARLSLDSVYGTTPGSDAAMVAKIPAGAVITYRVQLPASSNPVTVTPYVYAGATYSGTAKALKRGGWNIVMQTVPANTAVTKIGLRFTFRCPAGAYDCDPAYNVAYLDSVSYQEMPRTVQFSATAYSVREGSTAQIMVTRKGGSSGPASVSYAATGAQPSSNCPDEPPSMKLCWADGDGLAKTFAVQTTDDGQYRTGRTASLTLSSPSLGTSLGSPASATLTLIERQSASNPCYDMQAQQDPCQFAPPQVVSGINQVVSSDPVGVVVPLLPPTDDLIATPPPTTPPDTQLPDVPEELTPLQETLNETVAEALACLDNSEPCPVPPPVVNPLVTQIADTAAECANGTPECPAPFPVSPQGFCKWVVSQIGSKVPLGIVNPCNQVPYPNLPDPHVQ